MIPKSLRDLLMTSVHINPKLGFIHSVIQIEMGDLIKMKNKSTMHVVSCMLDMAQYHITNASNPRHFIINIIQYRCNNKHEGYSFLKTTLYKL